ncbi:uncharacterized protein LOC130646052 [Hydractinia symbiolongicarpus]|uniref:uncharacterized protein LOC130646052 n=1 Tax=Hydractinia symbiolongicarpus TaxID=13093 RepID=UPI002550F6E8|nr:uncharacterized protein LOC130646052 [Hydractinia symbiolongicarpus]
MGDFNVDYNVTNVNKDFKSTINVHGFKQLINKPTRMSSTSSTTIDLFFTNCPDNVHCNDVFPTWLSDHDMVGGIRRKHNIKHPMRTLKCCNYTNYVPKNLFNDVSEIDWRPVYDASDVNFAVTYFNSKLSDSFDKHAPLIEKRVKSRPCKWLTSKIKSQMNNRDKLHRKARKSGKREDTEKYKKIRNSCNNNIVKAKANHQRDLINENLSNPRKLWNAIKSVFPSKPKKVCQMSKDSESRSKVSNFSKFFSIAVHSLKSKSIQLMNFTWRYVPPFSLRTNKIFMTGYISKIFVEKELRSLKRNKATGIDELPPGMLKDCAILISKPLSHIINLSINTSTVPSAWKVAKVAPIFKSGDSSLLKNYRPISILPVLSKILEKAIHNELVNYLEKEKLLNDCQYGFRSKRSTKLASTLFCDSIRRKIDGGKLVGAVYIDLSKAFDTIGHSLLLNKLRTYGIKGKELAWFTDYFFNRSQLVDINNIRSSYEPIYCCVPQDDTVIYVAHKDVTRIEQLLNQDLERLSLYFRENELIINLKKGKTEVMLFGTAKRLKAHDKALQVVYQENPINFVSQYKYLGTVIDSKLMLNDNFDRSYKSASSRLRLLQRLRPCLTAEAAHNVFSMMIVPLITYSSALRIPITNTQLNKLKSLENRARSIVRSDNIPSITGLINHNICVLVKKCLLNDLTSEHFDNYFVSQQHDNNTQNNGFIVRLPQPKPAFLPNCFSSAFTGDTENKCFHKLRSCSSPKLAEPIKQTSYLKRVQKSTLRRLPKSTVFRTENKGIESNTISEMWQNVYSINFANLQTPVESARNETLKIVKEL